MALVRFPGTSPAANPDRDPDDTEIELTDADDLEPGGKMSFLEHLDELRKRLISSVIALIVGTIIAFFFLDRYIFPFIMLPLQQMLPDGGRLITTEATEWFMLWLKVGLLSGLLIAAPFILW
jgi:sec-independent protein translocase protein TatC